MGGPDVERELQPEAALARPLVDPRRDRHVRDALPRVVLEQGELPRAGARGGVADEYVTQLMDLLQADDVVLDRVVEVALLVLERLLAGGSDDDVHLCQGHVVDLTPLPGGEAAFDQADVAADDGGHVLPGLEPVAVEDRDAGVGGREHDVHVANDLARRLDWSYFDVQHPAHLFGEGASRRRGATVDLDERDRTDRGQGEQMVARLATGAEQAYGLGVRTGERLGADRTGRGGADAGHHRRVGHLARRDLAEDDGGQRARVGI